MNTHFAHKTEKHTAASIGGKAFNLLRLEQMQIPVPAWQVIPQSCVLDVLGDLQRSTDFEAIEQRIDAFKFDPGFETSLIEAFPNAANTFFAVRSSAVMEDGVEHSFAGLFESHLFVPLSGMQQAIKNIWKSTFSERVRTYLQEKELPQQYGIAVVIQEMLNPESSGVAFGANPANGNLDEHVVCSVYGVGEGLVSGALNADTFTVKEDQITPQLIAKDKAFRQQDGGGIRVEDVPQELQEQPSLADASILEISQLLRQLDEKLGGPQDIEFAIQNDKLFLLQTRPITTLPTQKTGERIIWDNSNIVESYPGVTAPLTFSYILTGYKNVYVQLARIMGASEKVIQENMNTFANMLGMINGRVYYNLLSWYKVLAIFPGYSLNAEFMENMMGVKERFELPKENQLGRGEAIYRMGIMLLRIAGNLFTIKKQTRKFLREVDNIVDEFKNRDLSAYDAFQLMEMFRSYDAQLLKRWKAPLVNDSFAMIHFGKLQKLIDKHKIGDNPNLHNDLMCGNNDIISVEPIRRSIAIATTISQSPALKTLFTENEAAYIWEQLQKNANSFKGATQLMPQIEAYIRDFGDRCVGELKLETVSYSQDPTLFIHIVRNLVLQNVTEASTDSNIEQQIRSEAEAEARKALKGKPWRRYKFNKALKKARYFVSNRENLRYDRTRVFGITRAIFAEIGKRFQAAGVLDDDRDIFYFQMQEIFAFIEGTSVDVDFKAIAKHRKAQYAAYEEMEPPTERIETFGTVNEGNDFYPVYLDEATEGDLQGIGCCPGKIKARVQVIHHPNEIDSLNGDILVTTSTDPGWVTLFPTASAILVERGSLLSHSAIVSREMGIPCIVSITGLLKRLKTGDVVEMDGRSGTIKILEENE